MWIFLHSIGAEANGKPTKKEKEKENERAIQVTLTSIKTFLPSNLQCDVSNFPAIPLDRGYNEQYCDP